LDDLIHWFPIAFKNGFDTAVPAILHPTFYLQSGRHLLSVVSEENPLYPPLNDDPQPDFFHMI
jgi:hypothetical protein